MFLAGIMNTPFAFMRQTACSSPVCRVVYVQKRLHRLYLHLSRSDICVHHSAWLPKAESAVQWHGLQEAYYAQHEIVRISEDHTKRHAPTAVRKIKLHVNIMLKNFQLRISCFVRHVLFLFSARKTPTHGLPTNSGRKLVRLIFEISSTPTYHFTHKNVRLYLKCKDKPDIRPLNAPSPAN